MQLAQLKDSVNMISLTMQFGPTDSQALGRELHHKVFIGEGLCIYLLAIFLA